MLNVLLLFIPLSLVLEHLVQAPAPWVFLTAVVGIIPLAEWIRRATEQLAATVGCSSFLTSSKVAPS